MPLKPPEAFEVQLPLYQARCTLEFDEYVPLPQYPLITLRGLLGFALRDLLHPGADTPPPDSPFWALFKPPNNEPHPVLLDAEPGAGPARMLGVTLRGFGPHAAPWLALTLDALEAGRARGFGAPAHPYRLHREPVERVDAPWEHPRAPGMSYWRYTIATPAQLTWRNRPVGPDSPIVHVLAWAGLRRLRELATHHGGAYAHDAGALETIIQSIRVLRVALVHTDGARTSTATGDAVAIGGLHGWIDLEASPDAARILAIATATGIGKKVFAGNGRVRIEANHDYARMPGILAAS